MSPVFSVNQPFPRYPHSMPAVPWRESMRGEGINSLTGGFNGLIFATCESLRQRRTRRACSTSDRRAACRNRLKKQRYVSRRETDSPAIDRRFEAAESCSRGSRIHAGAQCHGCDTPSRYDRAPRDKRTRPRAERRRGGSAGLRWTWFRMHTCQAKTGGLPL